MGEDQGDELKGGSKERRGSSLTHEELPPLQDVPNPFEYTTPPDAYEWFKLVFFYVTGIAILRMLLFLILLAFALLFSFLASLGLDDKTRYSNPFSKFRRAFLVPVGWICRVVLFILGFYHIKIKGKISPEAAFITPNHVSLFDSLALYWIARPSAIAKSELFEIPILGRIFKGLQLIPVMRESKEGREETKRLMKLFASSRTKPEGQRFPQILVFPQGTCTRDSVVSMFQRGAFNDGFPVQPVAIKYPHRYFDPAYVVTRKKDYFYRRHFAQFYMQMEVSFLPLYRPSEEEKRDPNLYAKNVRAVIAKELGAAVTDHYFEDAKLFREALDQRQAKHVLNLLEKKTSADEVRLSGLQLKEVRDVFGFNSGSRYNEVKNALKKFQSFDENDDGTISFLEFCNATGFPSKSRLSRAFFDFCDRNNDGAVDFRELVLSMALLSNQVTSEEKAQLAFKVFDINEDGYITTDELRSLLSWQNASDVSETVQKVLQLALSKGAQKSADDNVHINLETFLAIVEEMPDLVQTAIRKSKPHNLNLEESKKDQ